MEHTLRETSKNRNVKDFVVYDKEEPIIVRKPDGGILQIEEQYCGDHSLWFIVSKNEKREEISRHNLKYVAEWEWE
jgi:hypothetical protein